jgi:sRNA-binding regulator protein Hfq
MANASILPPERQPDVVREQGASAPSNGPVAGDGSDLAGNGTLPSVSPAGPRKLVRPILSEPGKRRYSRRSEPALLAHQALADHAIAAAGHDSSHAEVFYFQKQVQTQTLMCFVLDDGEKIEGYVEWFDRNAIKVRNSGRILIYKSSIKYLYKAGENAR